MDLNSYSHPLNTRESDSDRAFRKGDLKLERYETALRSIAEGLFGVEGAFDDEAKEMAITALADAEKALED